MILLEDLPIKWIGAPGKCYPDRIDRKTGKKYEPIAIVFHIMQGTLAGTAAHFNNPNVQASTHFGIGKNGEIHQYVAMKDGAWGNGVVNKPTWPLLSQFPGVNPNLFTISIELEGMHDLGNGKFHQFTDAQYDSSIKLVAVLHRMYNIPIDRLHIIGHCEIDSVNRPYCPGPTFDFNRVIKGARQLVYSFADIKGHWAEKAIERVASVKLPDGTPLLAGYPDGTFRPDDPLSRAEFAAALDRLLTLLGK